MVVLKRTIVGDVNWQKSSSESSESCVLSSLTKLVSTNVMLLVFLVSCDVALGWKDCDWCSLICIGSEAWVLSDCLTVLVFF